MNALSALRELEQQKARLESAMDNFAKKGNFATGVADVEPTKDDACMEMMGREKRKIERKIFWAEVAVRREHQDQMA